MTATNRFPIDVTAQDKFSAVFDRLNKVAGKATKPLSEVGKSLERAGKAAGFDKVGSAIAKIGGIATDAGKNLNLLGRVPKFRWNARAQFGAVYDHAVRRVLGRRDICCTYADLPLAPCAVSE